MKNLRINRLWFWGLVVVYFAIKIPLGQYQMAHLDKPVSSIDTPLVIALAIVVGARLTDAGRKRWIGIAATLVITMVLPLVMMAFYLALAQPAGTGTKQEFMELFSAISLVPLVLLIRAGTRPSAPSKDQQITSAFE